MTQFIEAIKKHICAGAPQVPEKDVRAAIERWEKGLEPRTPVENGVYAMCEKVRKDLDL